MTLKTVDCHRSRLDTGPPNCPILHLPPTRAKLDARRELCTGQKCPQFERCLITALRREATACDIIIVNHHLFFAGLAVREEEYGAIIPDYAAVIFDEAHEIEDVASQYFGISVSNYQLNDVRREIAPLARADHCPETFC